MLKKTAFICGYAGVTGAIGAMLRWIQLTAIVEDSGSLLRSSPVSTVLIIYLIAAAVGLLILIRGLNTDGAPRLWREALCSSNILYVAAAAVLALLTAIGAALLFVKAAETSQPGLERILSLGALATAFCYLAVAVGPKKDSDGSLLCAAAVIPVLFFCFWLIVAYKEYSANPSTWSFAIEILALCASVLAFFYMAGYAFDKPKPRRALFFSLLCVTLCIVALADARAVAKQLIFLATACLELMQAAVLLSNINKARESG